MVCSYTFAPLRVPANRRAAVAETMTRINARLWIGTFELDCSDGTMRVRMNAGVEDGVLSPRMAARIVHEGARTWDAYLDVLMAVSHGGVEPAVAVPT
ncbi:MAG: YbjN domain-containing protein [bacterium]